MPIGKILPQPTMSNSSRKTSATSTDSSHSSGTSSNSDTSGYSSEIPREPMTLEDYLAKLQTTKFDKAMAIRDEISKEFVTKDHMIAMERASRIGNFAGSFRSAGGPTLDALNRGAAAKGHNILEKTIKQASVTKAYGAAESGHILLLAKEKGLIGMVGRWDKKTNKITGIYVHNTTTKEDIVFPLDLDDDVKINQYKQAVENKEIIPYTGDYDMHDIIKFNRDTKRGHVPVADGVEEEEVKNLINREVAKIDANRPYEFIAKNVVRHGPQVNYVPHMWNHEKENVIKSGGYLGVVARMGEFSVAFVNRGRWEKLKSWVDLYRFYYENKTKIPEHWQQGGLVERKNGFVATPEHAAELDNLK
ncbi:hypothetical protein SC206_11585 [Rouxiella sp. T17]|uniref:hypothetical protein n=1 Tax=Rouxiella sp. T17 TaxID=3085684 RepID=UPI002FC78C31